MRYEYKTLKGFVKACRRLENNSISGLKGYNDLTQEQQQLLYDIVGQIGNSLGECEFDFEKGLKQ